MKMCLILSNVKIEFFFSCCVDILILEIIIIVASQPVDCLSTVLLNMGIFLIQEKKN